jgi:acetyl esterase/lipase
VAARPDLSRRGLLGAAGLAALLTACGPSDEGQDRSPASSGSVRKVTYGTMHPDQYGDLGMPAGTPTGLAVLVHGGFWRDTYGSGLMGPVAEDLRKRGYATWNIEYPRLGSPEVTPTLLAFSVMTAFDKVTELDLPDGIPSFSIGHSAGGQLAVLAASWDSEEEFPGFVPDTTVSLSGVLDLRRGIEQGVGGDAIKHLIGYQDPAEAIAHSTGPDPAQQVPASGTVIAVHAKDDELVPVDQSSSYVRQARAAGGDAELVLVPGGHFDLIDPASEAWAKVVELLGR